MSQRNPYDAYSTVPTLAERNGDLSALGRTIVDPATHQPFANNQIPASELDPAAQRLLGLIPLPNQPGTAQNFHTVTTVMNELDDVNVRVVHTCGAPQGGRSGGGPGGRRRRRWNPPPSRTPRAVRRNSVSTSRSRR